MTSIQLRTYDIVLLHSENKYSTYSISGTDMIGNNLPYTVEPLNNGHSGDRPLVHCREVVPISECPLSNVPLYVASD